MSIRGITFVNQIVKSDDDASLHNMLLSGRSGVMRGCDTTFDSSHIYVASGQFVILGRQVEVQGTETIMPEAVTEGKKYCRLVFEIDLSKTNTIETFGQGYFKVLSSSVSYPDVSQEDLTAGGTVYQYPWAKFTQTVNGIANFSNDTTVLQFSVDEVLSAVSENPVQNKVVYKKFEKIIDGTQQVGDSAKLGGKDASEYSLVAGTYLTTSILEYALTLPIGEHFIRFSGDSYSGNDLPSYNYRYGTATVNKRGSSSIEVILWGSASTDTRRIAVNFYNGSSWVGWGTDAKTSDLASYLSRDGGSLYGSVAVETSAEKEITFTLQNPKRRLRFLVQSGGDGGIYDSTNGAWVLLSTKDGTNTFNGTASGNLPLSGGKLSANSAVPLSLRSTVGTNSRLAFELVDTVLGYLGFSEQNKPSYYTAGGGVYDLLHTGNSAAVKVQASAPSNTAAVWVW